MQQLLDDPAASSWLKTALQAALRRDPVDAANEAAVLARALAVHAENILCWRDGVRQNGKTKEKENG